VFRNRIAVNIIFFLNGFLYGNWSSRIPRIKELYGISDQIFGFVLLTMALGAVAAMPFTGWMILKNGSRRISLFAVVGYCVFVPLIPFMPNWIVLMVLFLIIGVTTGMLDVAMNAQGVMVEKQYGKPIMTSFHAFFSIGMAVGGWCGSVFAGSGLTLYHHFAIAGAISVLATAWIRYNLIYDNTGNEVKPDGPLFRLPDKTLLGIGIIAFCCMLGEGSIANWSVQYMESVAFSTKALAPIAITSFAVAMTLGRIVGDRVRSAIGDSNIIISGGLVSAAGLVLSLVFPFPSVVIAGCFLLGLGLSTIVPVAYSIAGNTPGISSGVGIAMVTTVGYSGFLLGPPVIGFIAEWKDLRFGLSVVAALLVVMVLLGISLRKRSDPQLLTRK
jgi:MFS family permease